MRAVRCASSASLVSEYGFPKIRAACARARSDFTRLNSWSSRSKFRGECTELGESGPAGKPAAADGGGEELAVESEDGEVAGVEEIEAFLDLLVGVKPQGNHLRGSGEKGKRSTGWRRSPRPPRWESRCRSRCTRSHSREPWGSCRAGSHIWR